jgi:hypothetical protein
MYRSRKILLAVTLCLLASCGGKNEIAVQFPVGWMVLCTDEAGDVLETGFMGQKLGNPLLNDVADIERVVIGARDLVDGKVTSIEIGVRLKANTGNKDESYAIGGLPGLAQVLQPPSPASQSVFIKFTPLTGYEDSITVAIDMKADGADGHIDLFKGGRIGSFNASYSSGDYVAIVPVDLAVFSSSDKITVGAFASWTIAEAVFTASDTADVCKPVERDTVSE